MNSKAVFFLFLSVLAGLNLGTVRKAEDPIRDTQTNPILYEQKKEEEKDGKKGALMYHVKNVPRESFFIDPPFEKAKKGPSQEAITEEATSSTGPSSWWEEQSVEPQAAPPGETVSGPLPEPLLGEKKVPDDQAAEPSAAIPETEDATPGKGDDYWW